MSEWKHDSIAIKSIIKMGTSRVITVPPEFAKINKDVLITYNKKQNTVIVMGIDLNEFVKDMKIKDIDPKQASAETRQAIMRMLKR